jgi:hypothetical protein
VVSKPRVEDPERLEKKITGEERRSREKRRWEK